MEKCDSRTRAYRNGKTFDECRTIARGVSAKMQAKIRENGQAAWQDILIAAEHDELVYKLVLKYLRQDGFDIGNYKTPRVVPATQAS